MKLRLLLIAIFLMPVIGSSQSESPVGIGKFKIGQSLASTLIGELEKELNIKVVKESSSLMLFEFKNKTLDNYILELAYDSIKNTAPLEYNYCKGVKKYYLKKYSVANIPLKDIRLTFYNDTLIKFESDGSIQLKDALKVKYSGGKIKENKTRNSCLLYDNEEDIYTWENGDIITTHTRKVTYNTDCEKSFIRFLVLKNIKLDKFTTFCSSDEAILIRKKLKKEKKDNLSDF